MPLLFLEFLGTTELLVILVVALVLFGPRKLPQIGHSIGKSLSEFKRASEDFKRTWEMEVDMERAEKEARIETAIQPDNPSTSVPREGNETFDAENSYSDPLYLPSTDVAINDTSTADSPLTTSDATSPAEAVTAVPRKQDWL